MILKFENTMLQHIADDCGLYIAENNAVVTSGEIEFFVMQVLKTCINRVNNESIDDVIANNLKEYFGVE